MALECMNCRQQVAEDKARTFASVFVCETCCTMAERFYERSQRELKSLLILQMDGIRQALIEGRFHFGAGGDQEPSKADVFQAAIALEDARDKKRSTRT